MLAAKRVQGFSGFFFGLLFAAAWGALVATGVHLFAKLGLWSALVPAIETGASVGSTLFLLHQAPIGSAVLALRRRVRWTNVLFWPLLAAYHLLAFPGVIIGKSTGLVKLAAGKPAPATAAKAKAKPRSAGPCPFEGRVVAEIPVEFRDAEWSPQETIFEIHEDWRVSSAKLRYWGWVDTDGNVREGTGEPDSKTVATLRRGVAWAGDKRLGTLRVA